MLSPKQEYEIICNLVSALAVICRGDDNTIVDMLTGYLWDEEEAGSIKEQGRIQRGGAR